MQRLKQLLVFCPFPQVPWTSAPLARISVRSQSGFDTKIPSVPNFVNDAITLWVPAVSYMCVSHGGEWMGLFCVFLRWMNSLCLVFMDGGAKAQILSYSAEVITLGTGEGIEHKLFRFYLFLEPYPLFPVFFLSFKVVSLVQKAFFSAFWWFPLANTLSRKYSIALLKKPNPTQRKKPKPTQNPPTNARQTQANLFLFEGLVSVSLWL